MPDPATLSPIVNDRPTGADQLDFSRYVEALAGIILDSDTETPLTLGVFGGWGAGKTSLMMQVQDRVTGARDPETAALPTVWFDAWTYNQEDALWRALLLVLLDHVTALVEARQEAPEAERVEAVKLVEHLREALYRDVSWTEKGELRPNWAQAVGAGASLATNVVMAVLGNPLAAAGVAADGLQAAREEVGKGEPGSKLGQLAGAFRHEELTRYQAQLRSLEQFRENFARLVALALGQAAGQPNKLVVFVDDLDRCTPDKAIQVLEALKLFLDAPGCVFVLGLDPEAIEAAVQTRYRGEVKAREYLEKIIQLPFILPPIEDEPMRRYVHAIARKLPDERCVEVFALGLGGNPRKIKRILNIFLLLWRLVEGQPNLREKLTPVRLAKFVTIQHIHVDLYNLMRLAPGYLPELETYYRKTRAVAGRKGEIEGAGEGGPRLPDALQPFKDQQPLQRLLCLLDDQEARFDSLNPDEVRNYITLTRQATPLVVPVARLARLDYEPQMVAVAAGSFLMGTTPEQIKDLTRRYPSWAKEADQKGWFADEQPQHEVTLPAFEIGRFPVTNAQYAAFVEATGHVAPSYWPGGRLPEDLTDHPVVNVSWFDARDYVQWLADRTGLPYHLPAEAQWEKAARGADGCQWPWGNEWDAALANCKPAGPGRTTPVGQYSPAGDSPCDAADMAGNVWEWC